LSSKAETAGWTAAFAIVLGGAVFFVLSGRADYLDRPERARPPILAARYLAFAESMAKQQKGARARDAYTLAARWAASPVVGLYSARGDAEFLAKDFASALKDFDRVIARSPREAYPRLGKAACLASIGRYREAIRSASQAIKIEPRMEQAFAWRAVSELRSERYKEAEADYGRIIELNPKAGYAYLARSYVRCMRKDPAGSKTDIVIAVTFDPGLEADALHKAVVDACGKSF
jgi:tetratricopeptide (TPR) repeat protein